MSRQKLMKVLVQNHATGRFLGRGDRWYKSADMARDFGEGKNAIDYYISHPGMDAVQIVLHFDRSPRLDIQLPLGGTRKDTRPAVRA